MAPKSEVLSNGPTGGEKPLGVPGRLEPMHAPPALAGGLMRVFRTVIQVSMLAMFHTGQGLALRRAVARQFIRNREYCLSNHLK